MAEGAARVCVIISMSKELKISEHTYVRMRVSFVTRPHPLATQGWGLGTSVGIRKVICHLSKSDHEKASVQMETSPQDSSVECQTKEHWRALHREAQRREGTGKLEV